MEIRLENVKIAILLLIFLGGIFACSQDSFNQADCPYPSLAKLDSIKQIFYSPYTNKKYSEKTDTVSFEDFRFHIQYKFEKTPKKNDFNEILAIPTCEPEYDVLGISNFAIILTAPYDGIQTGNDVSYLFLLPNGNSINKFRDFFNMKSFMTLKLREKPRNISQLKTELVIYMVNGDRIKKTSTSPFIKPD